MRLTIVAAISLMLAGCSTATPSPDQLQAHGNALVKGMKSSYFSLGSTYDVKIKSVDDKPTWNALSGYAEQMELSAGHHRLVVACRMVAEMGNTSTDINDTSLDVDLAAGHIYELQPAAPATSGGCGAKINETATGN